MTTNPLTLTWPMTMWQGDEVVDNGEVRKCQSVLSSTAKVFVNILNLGSAQSRRNYIRCFDNTGSLAEDVPVLKILPKVHKDLTPQGHPQSRPVVAASSGSLVPSWRRHC